MPSVEDIAVKELLEFLVGMKDVLEWIIQLPREDLEKFGAFLRSKPCVIHPEGHPRDVPVGNIREMLDTMQGMCEGLLYMASESPDIQNILRNLGHT